MRPFLMAIAAGGIVALTAGSASALPINNLAAAAATDLHDVRLVCTRSGRCYETRPRYRQRVYRAPAYGYRHRPSYGYGHAPTYGYRSHNPGVGLNFRF